MSKSAFDKIAEGLEEAISVAQGNSEPAHLHVPLEIDVKTIRKKTGLSQDAFASTFAFSVHQVRQWEQGRVRPLGAMRAYLMMIDKDHGIVLRLLNMAQSENESPARKCG
ncbi:transcriptional regulator [Acetobacter aceti]|uniref:Transcriptional regulator n=1 Tax=Acetobacter aceti TaxID=435 RepID=A0A6S6PM04_ACEAC|nr:transcriptional regulator [Acetobacter aceti]BCI68080.1 transcriptional regulator [Acetobacter aceti]